MGHKPQDTLTELGKGFIRRNCSGSGNSKLEGKHSFKYAFADGITTNTVWLSDIGINGGIETNDQLASKLIDWFNYYGKECGVDPNYLAAQSFHESTYFVWTYPEDSTSVGLGQFLSKSFYDILLHPNPTYDKYSNIIMTSEDKERLTVGVPKESRDDINFWTTMSRFRVYGKNIVQNIVNNPELSIKMQARYMGLISNYYDDLASNALFGYNKGQNTIVKGNYHATYAKASKTYSEKNLEYGRAYVKKIFLTLYESFGYTGLKMNTSTSEFNSFSSNTS